MERENGKQKRKRSPNNVVNPLGTHGFRRLSRDTDTTPTPLLDIANVEHVYRRTGEKTTVETDILLVNWHV